MAGLIARGFVRLGGRHLLDQLRAVLGVERRLEGQHLVERQPECVEIGPAISVPLETLRGHVPERADDVPLLGQVVGVMDLASPKSVTQTVPWRSRSKLAGLMSRCRMPCAWA